MFVSVVAWAQAPAASGVDPRVEAMQAKMSLVQRIDLISGVNGMFIRARPEIDFPRLKMSDGPMGV